MQDQGFQGTGSRFCSRFEAGSPILAKQLNDLAAGVQATMPTPYLGEGASVSYLPGGSIITTQPSISPSQTQIFPFQVSIQKNGTEFQATIVRGFIISANAQASVDAPTSDVLTFNGITNGTYFANKIAVYPAGSLTNGTDSNSAYMNSGGYVVMPSTTADVYFCVIRNVFAPDDGSGLPAGMIKGWPYVGVIVSGSDADVKTFPVSGTDEINYKAEIGAGVQEIDVYEPGSSEPVVYNLWGTSPQDGVLRLENYNWSRLIFAKASWDGSQWNVTQFTNSDVVLPLVFSFNKFTVINSGITPTTHHPENDVLQNEWYQNYAGYEKSFTSATVQIGP